MIINVTPFRGWRTALVLTAAVGIVGLLGVGLLLLVPSPVARSAFKAWNYSDRRWLVALYFLAVALVYVPGILMRAFSASDLPTGSGTRARDGGSRSTVVRPPGIARGLAAIAVGSMLALLYVVPLVPALAERRLETHELVHLGSIQAIDGGAHPYTGAMTQYGPGHQYVSYKFMRATEFSMRGFRMAHMCMNLVIVSAFFSLIFFAFGWRVGAAVVGASLFVSPLLTTSFVGWGVLARWFGPVVVGICAPLVLWRQTSSARQPLAFALMGMVCGALAWFSQENASTAPITALFVLAGAIVCGRSTVRKAGALLVVFGITHISMLLALLAWYVGPSHLAEALTIYRRGGELVWAGVTGGGWVPLNSAWSRPGVVWTLAYYLTPVVIVTLTALILYLVPLVSNDGADTKMGQLLGMLAAGASLYAVTLLHADPVHYIGPSFAISPIVILSVVYLPLRLFDAATTRTALRVAMAAVFLVVYPFAWAEAEYRIPPLVHLQDFYRGARILNDVRQGNGTSDQSSVAAIANRLGYRPDLDSRCCTIRRCCGQPDFTYGDWEHALAEVRAIVGRRSLYVDTDRNASVFGEGSSAVYFLGDLKVSSRFVDPMMSLWIDDDIAALEQELRAHPPDCLLTGGHDYLMTPFVLGLFGEYTEAKTSAPVNGLVYCAKRP